MRLLALRMRWLRRRVSQRRVHLIWLFCTFFLVMLATVLWLDGVKLLTDMRASVEDSIIEYAGPSSGAFKTRSAPPLQMAIVEIDDDAVFDGKKGWLGHGGVTSRGRLADLLRQTLAAGPKYLMVDLDLSGDSGDPEGDAKLKEALTDARIVRGVPILMARAARVRNPHSTSSDYEYERSPFDPIMGNPAFPWLHWVDPTIISRGGDVYRWMGLWSVGQARRVSPSDPPGGAKGKTVNLSPALVIAILEQQGAARGNKSIARLEASLLKEPASSLAKGHPAIAGLSQPIQSWIAHQARRPDDDSRIVFPYSNVWKYPQDRIPDDTAQAPCSGHSPLLAIPVTSLEGANGSALLHCLNNALVFVGRTDGGSGDWRLTPRDSMPGVAIVAATIFTTTTLDKPLVRSGVLVGATIFLGLALLVFTTLIDLPGWLVLLVLPFVSLILFLFAFGEAIVHNQWLDLTDSVFIVSATEYLLVAFGMVGIAPKREH